MERIKRLWFAFVVCLAVGLPSMVSAAEPWDTIDDFVTTNSPLLTGVLVALFGVPAIFALFKLAKRALGKV